MPEILSPMEAAPPSLPPPAPPAKDAPGPAEAAPAASEVGNPSSPDAAALPVQAGKGAVVAAPPPPKSSPLVKLLARGTPTNYNMVRWQQRASGVRCLGAANQQRLCAPSLELTSPLLAGDTNRPIVCV